MKYLLLTILLLAGFQLLAQRRNEEILYYVSNEDTLKWYNKEIQSQLDEVHGDFILFYLHWDSDRIKLDPQKDPPGWPRTHSAIFQFGFGAAEEIWERKFGQRFPEQTLLEKLHSLRDEQKRHLSFEGKIYRNSIIIERSWQVPVMGLIDSTIPADSVENRGSGNNEGGYRVFERMMELDGGFTGGAEALQIFVNEQMRDTRPTIAPGDSIIYFQGVIKRDSMLHDIKLIEPIYETEYTKKLSQVLVMPKRLWLPIRKDRILNSYILIYIRVKPDGTLRVEYP
jgi:hypothetical protein